MHRLTKLISCTVHAGRMKTFFTVSMMLAILSSAGQLQADVAMRLQMQRTSFMMFEPITATLTMRNTTGQVLVFGGNADLKGYLGIELTNSYGRPLTGTGTKVDLRGLLLRPGIDQTIRVELSRWVNLSKVGFYRVKLTISHPMLHNEYESNACQFEVSNGNVFWTRSFGIPRLTDEDKTKPPKQRTYTLRALRERSDIFLYLIIEDKEKIYTMSRVGRIVGHERARCELDMLNRLHMLLPLTPKLFVYQIFDWNGESEGRKIYKTTDTVPVLVRDNQSGQISVIGGQPAQLGVDYSEEKLMPDTPVLDTNQSIKDGGYAAPRGR